MNKYITTIVIKNDPEPESPREWDNVGTMVCWHSRYNLGDEQPSCSSDDYLMSLAEEFDPSIEARIDRFSEKVFEGVNFSNDTQRNKAYRELDAYQSAQIDKALEGNVLRLPLYLYDHSGISMSTGGFGCPWDSGQVGFIYVRVADVKKERGWKRMSPKRNEQVLNILKGEVETYDQHLTGQVYGFEIYEHLTEEDAEQGEFIDSCWGFFSGDFGRDWETNGMTEHWPEGWENFRILVNGDEEQEWSAAA